MNVQSYVVFEGRCEEAVEFYKRAVGAKVEMLMRIKDSPEPPDKPLPPGAAEKIMHGELRIGDTTVMVSDGFCTGTPEFKGFALAIAVKSEAEADRYFGALADGGQVTMPLGKTFFSPRFGMLTDRFGIRWMVNVTTR